MALLVTACAAVNVWEASSRRFWFDECFTVWLSRLPVRTELLRALAGDANPPLLYVVVKLSRALFGESELAVRIPSLVAYTTASVAVFFFVRKHCSTIAALFSVAMMFGNYLSFYASEGRSYALLLGFLSLSLLCWQQAVAALEEGRARWWPLAGLTVSMWGAVLSHHYAPIQLLLPLGAGEAARLWQRRRPDTARVDKAMIAACAIGLAPLAFTLPLARDSWNTLLQYTRSNPVFFRQPEPYQAFDYGQLVLRWLLWPWVLACLLGAVSWILSERRQARDPAIAQRVPDVAAAMGLVLILPAMVIFTTLSSRYFIPRYAMGAAMGMAILGGMATSFLGPAKNLCAILLLGNSLYLGQDYALRRAYREYAISFNPQNWYVPVLDGGDPIVFADALQFAPAWWYADPPLRDRVHYLADPPYAVRQPDFIPEIAMVVNRPYLPAKTEDYQEFLAAHRRFLVIGRGWIVARLIRDGWAVEHLGAARGQEVVRATAP